MQWWFCLRHMAVEGERGCAHADRMGPYETEEAAKDALKTAREKSEAFDRADAWDREDD